MTKRPSHLQSLKDRGFDESSVILFGGGWRPRCSRCEVLVINGVATHETGCPNQDDWREDRRARDEDEWDG